MPILLASPFYKWENKTEIQKETINHIQIYKSSEWSA